MRLKSDEIAALIDAINQHVVIRQSELRLYGSRVKDHLKGGDIDLLLILPDPQSYDQVLKKKIDIILEMKEKIGDQKIDFTLAKRDEISIDPFLSLIYHESILLFRWDPCS